MLTPLSITAYIYFLFFPRLILGTLQTVWVRPSGTSGQSPTAHIKARFSEVLLPLQCCVTTRYQVTGATDMASASYNKQSRMVAYDPDHRPTRKASRIDADTWQSRKPRILYLYVEQNKTLDRVIVELNAEQFPVS